MSRVRFERHEGSGYPLRVVFPDGSWLAVDRDHRGLHAGDARGRILQLLGPDEFQALSPRQFAEAYRRAFGRSLRKHAVTATLPRESDHPDPPDRLTPPPSASRSAAPDEPTPDEPTPDEPTPVEPAPDEPTPDEPPRRGFPDVPSSYVPEPPREDAPQPAHAHAGLSRPSAPSEPPIVDPFAAASARSTPPPVGRVRALFYPDPARTASLALLLVRLAAGGLLVPHGAAKVAGGVAKFAGGLAARGMPAPLVLAWCATLAELAGGLLVALGLLTRPAALSACVTMAVAWSTSHLADAARIGTGKGVPFEYPLLLSVIFLAITIAGPGRYSLDALIFGQRRPPSPP